MWRYESLVLLYSFAGLAVWTWVIRNHHPRARQRARGMKSIRRRQRIIERIGVGCIAVVALLAAVAGFVDARGVALVLGFLVMGVQTLIVLAFQGSQAAIAPMREAGRR